MLAAADRPRMPTTEDQERAEQQANRATVAAGRWTDIARQWQLLKVGEEIDAVLGEPDTSVNTLGDMGRQLTTPGLYGLRPMMRHAGEQSGLVAIDGPLDQCGWATKMQMVQYLTLTVGDMFARFDVDPRRRRLTCRLVMPHDVWTRTDPADPSCIVELWELRVFTVDKESQFCWEVFDISNPAAPSHRVHLTDSRSVGRGEVVGGLGRDVTAAVLGAKQAETPYPWLSTETMEGPEGPVRVPVIPYAHWQDMDAGQQWNHLHRRDAYVGALNAALFWTYTNRGALNATGTYVMTANLVPHGVNVHKDGGPTLSTKTITPGATDHYSTDGEKTPYVWVIPEGVNLPNLLEFADRYELKQATRWGLNPSDLTRTAANPSSAAALMVSDEGKQRFSRQVEPVFRRSDLEAFRIAAIVHRAGGLGDLPETGYTTQYPAIAPTPQQAQALRDDLTWQLEQGTLSHVDVYMRLNPGSTEEDAVRALRKVRAQEAELNRELEPDDPDPTPTPPTPGVPA